MDVPSFAVAAVAAADAVVAAAVAAAVVVAAAEAADEAGAGAVEVAGAGTETASVAAASGSSWLPAAAIAVAAGAAFAASAGVSFAVAVAGTAVAAVAGGGDVAAVHAASMPFVEDAVAVVAAWCRYWTDKVARRVQRDRRVGVGSDWGHGERRVHELLVQIKREDAGPAGQREREKERGRGVIRTRPGNAGSARVGSCCEQAVGRMTWFLAEDGEEPLQDYERRCNIEISKKKKKIQMKSFDGKK